MSRTKTNGGESRRGPLPPAFFLGSFLVQAALHLFVPAVRLVPAPWTGSGLVPIALGIAAILAGDRRFKRASTAISPFEDPSSLVTGGLFGVSRNPMYLGMVLALVGASVCWGTLTPMVVPWAFAGLIQVRFIRHEERALARVFGEEYGQYRERVRRWL